MIGHLKECRFASRQQVKCLSRQAALAPAATPGNIFRCALVGFIVLRVLLIGYAFNRICLSLDILPLGCAVGKAVASCIGVAACRCLGILLANPYVLNGHF